MAELLHMIAKLSVLAFGRQPAACSRWADIDAARASPRRCATCASSCSHSGLNFRARAGLRVAALRLSSSDGSRDGRDRPALLLGGAARCAPFLPKLVENARGNPALAGALMEFARTLGTILFLPFALPLMIPGLQANAWSIARPLLLFIVLPLVGGMIVKSFASATATRAAPVFAKSAAPRCSCSSRSSSRSIFAP